MGMDINIYIKEFSADLLSKIKQRFADFHMDIEFHPEFKFDEKTDSGFLPIKLNLHTGHSNPYDKIEDEVLTGFELVFSDYDFEEDLKELQQQTLSNSKRPFFSKFLSGNKPEMPIVSFVADKELDKLLTL